MLRVNNLKKYFGGIKAVNDCSFNIEFGKITALIGPNGAGKTTVFNIIMGMVRQDFGEIYFENKVINTFSIFQRANLGISRTFQQIRLFKNLNIFNNLLLAVTKNDQNLISSLFSKFHDSHSLRIQEVLKLVGLDKDISTNASDLSYGQQKLLQIAIALLFNHKMLLLDEPVAGVSPFLRDQLKNILTELKNQKETILLIEHDMNFVFEIADTVIVMDQGKVLTTGSPEEIKNNPHVLEVYLGKQL